MNCVRLCLAAASLGALTFVTACEKEPVSIDKRSPGLALEIKPGDLFEVRQADPANATTAHTITISVGDPNPSRTNYPMSSSNAANVRPKPNDNDLLNSMDMNISSVEPEANDRNYLIKVIITGGDTIFHKKWPLTTNSSGKPCLALNERKDKELTFIVREFKDKNKQKECGNISYNLHYTTKVNFAGKTYINDWAFDPKIRNDG